MNVFGYENPDPSVKSEKIGDARNSENSQSNFDYSHMKKIYFAFIDVLGFKKAFDDNELLPKESDVIKPFGDVFSMYFKLMNKAAFLLDTETYTGQTSDSLYFYTSREDILIKFLEVFSFFNLYAMSKNVFFRGGIAKGELYRKENYQFFGDSVIKAYLMESSISRHPIITIDDGTYNDIQSNDNVKGDRLIKKREGERRAYLKPFWCIDKSFSDALSELDPLIYDEIIEGCSKSKIIKVISGNQQKFEYDAKNYSKYCYSGAVVKTFSLTYFNELGSSIGQRLNSDDQAASLSHSAG